MPRPLLLVLVAWLAGCGGRSTIGGGGPALPAPGGDGQSCLPIPATQVRGTYAGSWQGSIRCPEETAVAGEVSFELVPAGEPDAFAVRGKLSGTVTDPAFPMQLISGEIEGTMGCTTLSAQLSAGVGGTEGPALPLEGRMTATLVAGTGPAGGSVHGFEDGSWNVAEPEFGGCPGSGTWRAARVSTR
jgi:hypothetical protein